jgi:hypothetical protein
MHLSSEVSIEIDIESRARPVMIFVHHSQANSTEQRYLEIKKGLRLQLGGTAQHIPKFIVNTS